LESSKPDQLDLLKSTETQRIIRVLSRGGEDQDLILELCQQYNLRWGDVSKAVDEVGTENAERIALRQLPLKSFIAIALGVGGFALFTVSLFLMIDMLIVAHQVVTSEGLNSRELLVLPMFGSDMLLSSFLNVAKALPMLVFFMIQGLAMLLGSVIGMKEYWQLLVERVAGVLWK
jgi:hypothetical protein